MRRAAILLSGGIDSAALCYWQKPEHAIHINYGQKAAVAESRAATAIAAAVGIPLSIIRADLSPLGQGIMAGTGQSQLGATPEWWPFRNQLLITLAAMKMAATGQTVLLIGTVATDRLHRDSTAAFREAMGQVLSLQEGKIHLSAPASRLRSAQLVRKSRMPHEIVAWTHSCHVSALPCGRCRGCTKHALVLREIGLL